MMEIISPAWLAIVVDGGRHGQAHAGVPSSAVLDSFAYRSLNHILANDPRWPALEVMGSDFRLRVSRDTWCAVTGARVSAFVNDIPVDTRGAFLIPPEGVLRVGDVLEGLRYYVGFSGRIEADYIMGSYSTNIECNFGGYHGRPLMKGDRLILREPHGLTPTAPADYFAAPRMRPPHRLRVLEGPEWDYFTGNSLHKFVGQEDDSGYMVSPRVNRTGIRLEGGSLRFRESKSKSITSEGVFPGTIQVPGDGLPIIVLNERTIGGYARIAMVAKVDLDRLAHLRPRDRVCFQMVGLAEAEQLWKERKNVLSALFSLGS